MKVRFVVSQRIDESDEELVGNVPRATWDCVINCVINRELKFNGIRFRDSDFAPWRNNGELLIHLRNARDTAKAYSAHESAVAAAENGTKYN